MSNKTLKLDNAPKASGRILDDTEEQTLKPVAAALNEALKAMDEDLSAPSKDPEAQAATATAKLADFSLSRLASSLLDRALDNVSENSGRGIEDTLARDQVQVLASIIKASGNDLTNAIGFVVETMEGDAGTYVYKLCYATQKALNFIGNMAYRRALDPKSDFDLEQFVDYREEERDPPAGLGKEPEIEFNDRNDPERADHDVIVDALEELHVYLQILTESFGWDPDRPMPYMAIYDELADKFEHVYNCEDCLDRMEIRFKESKVKRQQKQLNGMKRIQAAALEALKKRAAK